MTTFAVTYDYRCPFARIAHLHVVAGLEAGADWNVTFLPFSLGQVHVEEGQPSVWDAPDKDSGLLALRVSAVVRERHPDAFLAVHRGLFEARHTDGADLRDPEVISALLSDAGVDAAAVLEEANGAEALDMVRADHDRAADDNRVWGVPTFVVDENAVFVRLMAAPADGADATRTVERVIDMMAGWPELNEFKHTSVRR